MTNNKPQPFSIDPLNQSVEDPNQQQPRPLQRGAGTFASFASALGHTNNNNVSTDLSNVGGGEPGSPTNGGIRKTQSTLSSVHNQQQPKPPPVTVSDLELENIRRIFNQFDADGSNSIDVEELAQVMTSLGVQMDEDQLKQLVEQVTSEPDSYELSFDEFVSLITLWKEAAQYKLFEGTGFKSLAAQHVEQALETEAIIPDTFQKALWDLVVCLVAVTYWIVVLLLDAYTVDGVGHTGGLIAGDIICTLFLIADVVICSRTAFSRDGRTIDNRADVFQNYKKSWLVPDILAALPLDLILSAAGANTAATVLRHLRLFKLLKVPFLWKTSDVMPITSSYITFHFHLLPIFQLAITFIVMVHGFAIGWVLLKQSSCSDPIITEGCVYSYNVAIYMTIYTISTVGLGDVEITGESEQWYACAVLVGAMASNGIVIGKLVQILQRADIKKEQRSKLRETLAVLEHYHIATQLQTEILQFQAHVFENNLGAAYESIVSDLPAEMRTNISLFVRMKLVSVVPIFHQSHFMLRIAVAQALTNAVARPEQYMCVAGQKIDGLYFLAYGFADTFDVKGQYKQTLRSGDFFGDESLIGNGTLDESVKALTYCDMWILDSDTFEGLLERFPKFRRTVELLRSIEEEKMLILQQAAAKSNSKSNTPSRGGSPQNVAIVISEQSARSDQMRQSNQNHDDSLQTNQSTKKEDPAMIENQQNTSAEEQEVNEKLQSFRFGESPVPGDNNTNNDGARKQEQDEGDVKNTPPKQNQEQQKSSGDSEEKQRQSEVTVLSPNSSTNRRKSVVTFRAKEESIIVEPRQEKPVSVRDVEKFLRQVRKFKEKLKQE